MLKKLARGKITETNQSLLMADNSPSTQYKNRKYFNYNNQKSIFIDCHKNKSRRNIWKGDNFVCKEEGSECNILLVIARWYDQRQNMFCMHHGPKKAMNNISYSSGIEIQYFKQYTRLSSFTDLSSFPSQ